MPVRRVGSEPTEPVSRPPNVAAAAAATGVGGDTAQARAGTRTPPRGPSRRTWRIAGICAGVALIAGAVLVLADPGRLPTRAELREARQEARSETAAGPEPTQPSPTVEDPPTVAEASDRLLDAILAADAAGQIFDDDVTAELLDDTDEVKEAHGTGDAEWLQVEYPDLIDEVENAIADGQVSEEAGEAIGAALDGLILAIENDPLESPSPSQEGDDGDD